MKNKFKSFLRRSKAVIAACIVAATAAVTTVCASAETAEAGSSMMSTVVADAGEQITASFNDLVITLVPVIIGILISGLTIFGIFALIKLSKKVFGKVAG